jgi:hypothetical protein
VTTAGGVKLLVLPAGGGWNLQAFGARGDGATDDTAALQRAVDICRASPGRLLRIPRGSYVVTATINNTYTGGAGGLASGYYGFAIEGEDAYNTILLGRTAGTPVLDFTGKSRMTLRNLSIANYTDGAHNPSCFLLLARNLTNGFAGGHLFERCTFRGFANQTLVQTASAECCHWIKCDFDPFRNGCSTFELTDQLLTTVVSPYVSHVGHTFSGGNTWQKFDGCSFNASTPTTGTHAVRVAVADNVTFDTCYSHGLGNCTFLFVGTSAGIEFHNHRHESAGSGSNWFIQLAAGAVIDRFAFTGRSARAIRGEDGSAIRRARITADFLAAGGATHSLDAWDFTDSEARGLTNDIRVRNSAAGSRLLDAKLSTGVTLPTGAAAPAYWRQAYSGGSAAYSRDRENTDGRNRTDMGRVTMASLQMRLGTNTTASALGGTLTPDSNADLSASVTLDQNLTLNAPSLPDPLTEDQGGRGMLMVLSFRQDATGGRTVTFPANYVLNGATVAAAANAVTAWLFVRVPGNGADRWVKIA